MKERRIKYIYWFAYYNFDSPSVRYRGKYPLDFAKEKLGIKSRLITPGYSFKHLVDFITAYLSALLFLKRNALIVVQRVQSNFIYANLLKLLVLVRKRQTVYDLDDADYLLHNVSSIRFFAKHCNCIAAGSESIAQYMSTYNKNIIYLTSPTPDLKIVKQQRNKIFTIGWLGSFGGGHKQSLYECIFPAVKELPFDCALHIIGVFNRTDEQEIRQYFEPYSHVKLSIPQHIDWNNEETLQRRVTSFDIGIATLLNEPMHLAKSGIKAKQYMNNGVPVLSHNLPENNKVVIHGFNGFLCDTSEAFKQRMIQFKEMPLDEYNVFVKNARQSICHFDHNKYLEDLDICFRKTS